MMIQPDHSQGRRRAGMLLAGTVLIGTLVATATPVLADPVDPPAPPAAPAAPEAPDAPQPPEPPAPPAHADGIQTIGISGENGVYVTRIGRDDGTTVILRTNRRLSDAEVGREVRNAERSRERAEREAARHRETSRVIIRNRDAMPSESDIAAIVAEARAEAARAHADADRVIAENQRIVIDMRRVRADAQREARRALRRANAAQIIDCGDGETARRVIERSGDEEGDSPGLRIVTCTNGSPALQLDAMRVARRALADMEDNGALAAEHRASALAELDEQIAELEREIADRQN